MSDNLGKKRLDALEVKLNALRKPVVEKREESHYNQAQAGWRMVTELVVGLLLGAGIGYGLDVLFGVLPIFLVIFTVLGFIAGVRTMMRTATEIQTKVMTQDEVSASPNKDEMYDDD